MWKRRYTESSEALSGGNLSYISSSAHTEHNSSEEYEQTSVSNSDKNNMLTTSVNTSDINFISKLAPKIVEGTKKLKYWAESL